MQARRLRAKLKLGLAWVLSSASIQGLYWDNGKANGNYYLGFSVLYLGIRVCGLGIRV